MAASVEEVISYLRALYAPMEDMCFSGMFLRTESMPLTGNDRDIIQVTSIDDFNKGILEGVCNNVLQEYGDEVWKGVTGPVDKPEYNNYWIWVKRFSPGLIPGKIYSFQVRKIEPIYLSKPKADYNFVINITLE